MSEHPKSCRIKILKNGPVLVSGGVPISQDDMIIGADNEPERWEKSHFYPPASTNALCRCGASGRKPFCGPVSTERRPRLSRKIPPWSSVQRVRPSI